MEGKDKSRESEGRSLSSKFHEAEPYPWHHEFHDTKLGHIGPYEAVGPSVANLLETPIGWSCIQLPDEFRSLVAVFG